MGTYSFVLHESRCSNNCVFCGSRDFGEIQENVRLEKLKIENLLRDGHDISTVEISGNDPLEYPGLCQVAEWLRDTLPQSRIRLSTHARRIRPLLPQLIDAGISHFIIPIYGHQKEIHDAVTRASGSFEETIDSIDALRKAHVKFSLTTLITSQNMSTLSELFVFLGSLADMFSVSVPLFSPGKIPPQAVNILELRGYLEQALSDVQVETTTRVRLRNLPRCALANTYGAEFEGSRPPRFGYEHRRYVRGAIELIETTDGMLPDYQLMVKSDACNSCIYDETCGGFYHSYAVSGLFEFRPVQLGVSK